MRRVGPATVRRCFAIRALLALLAASWVAACGGREDDEKTPVEVYAGQYSSATCAEMEPCCRANGLTFDKGQCSLGGAGYFQLGVDAEVKAGATFDAQKADLCIQASVAAVKTCTPVALDSAARKACAVVWSGPKKVGEACKSSAECASSDEGPGVCILASGNGDGKCSIRTISATAKVGDVCGIQASGDVPPTVADCEGNDLQCSLGQTQTCVDLVALGGGCGEFNRCAKGLFCDNNTCAAALGAGAACTDDAQCKSGLCIRGKCGDNGVGSITPCTGEKQ